MIGEKVAKEDGNHRAIWETSDIPECRAVNTMVDTGSHAKRIG